MKATYSDSTNWRFCTGAACIPLAFLACFACESRSVGQESQEAEEGPWWELSQSASVSIGGASAEGPAALHRVRQGMVLSDGQIVLALQDEVLLFTEEGTFKERLGRAGEGPGEYRSIASMVRDFNADHIRVFDGGNRRISRLTLDGETVDTEPVLSEVFPLGGVAVLQPDGSLVGRAWMSMLDRLSGTREPIPTGPRFDSLILVRVAGAGMDTISIRQSGLLITSRTGNWTFTRTPPLGGKLLTAVGSGIVAQGYSDAGEFLLVGLDGAEFGVARTRAKRRQVTDSIWSAAGQEFLRRLRIFPIPGQSREALLRDVLKDSPNPESLPLIDQVSFDLQQNLWLRRFLVGEGQEAVWEIHSKYGRFLAGIRMPANLEPLEIGHAYVLGVQKDSLEVETVVRFELVRGE